MKIVDECGLTQCVVKTGCRRKKTESVDVTLLPVSLQTSLSNFFILMTITCYAVRLVCRDYTTIAETPTLTVTYRLS
jgi:hypothetical protein